MIAWLAVAEAADADVRFWRGQDLRRGRRPVEWSAEELVDCVEGIRLDPPERPSLVSVGCTGPGAEEVRIGWLTASFLAHDPQRVEGQPFRAGHVGKDGDFDGDGAPEALGLYAFEGRDRDEIRVQVKWASGGHDAQLRGRMPPDLQSERWDSLGDLDGDGRDELLLSLATTTATRLHLVTGATLDGWDGQDRGIPLAEQVLLAVRSTGVGGLATCDIDGDGVRDVIGADAIWVGRRLLEHPRARARRIGQPVCLGDLDGDGTEEVLATVGLP